MYYIEKNLLYKRFDENIINVFLFFVNVWYCIVCTASNFFSLIYFFLISSLENFTVVYFSYLTCMYIFK